MATRIITGVLDYPNGDPWVAARVRFSMVSGSYTVSPAVTYPQTSAVAITDTTGAFSTTLVSGLGIWWDCVLPDGDGFRFALNDGSAVTLEQLRAEATGDPEPISYATSDIVITSATSGQILRHNGTHFVNVGWPTINVQDAPYGAVGDGSTDDTNAIQSAIDAAGTGAVVYIPDGIYKITDTLVIGDGDGTTFSTINAVAIVGCGPSWENGGTFSGEQPPGTTLRWYGAAGGTMMQVNGPIGGVRIENLTFAGYTGDVADNPDSMLVVHHAMYSTFRRLMAQGFSGSAYLIDAYNDHPDTVSGANNNLWEQVNSGHFAAGPTATAMTLGNTHQDALPETDVSLNTFISCTWYGGALAGCTGLLLRNTDNNAFYQCYASAGTNTVNSGGGLRRATVTGTTSWPGGNTFTHCGFFPDVRNDNPSWDGSDTFIGYITGDGQAIPTDITSRGFTYDGRWFGTWYGLPMISELTGALTPVAGASQIYYDNGDGATKVKHGDGSVGVLEGVRYVAGQGGFVTQLTSKATTVVLSKRCGQIVCHNAALASDTSVTFTWTNTLIVQTDVIAMNHVAGGNVGNYVISPAAGTGSATVTIRNITGGGLSDALVLNFAVIRAVNS